LRRLNVLTTNEGKIKEFIELGKRYGVEVNVIKQYKVEIQSSRLEDIALTAAILASIQLKDHVVVEDAGLFINSLSGFPGVYSNYVFKTIGIKGILKLLEGVKDRSAYFKSVLAFADMSKGVVKIFTGVTEGFIAYEPKGTLGFGFDPIFIPKGYSKTFAEMSIEEKNMVSHRAKAFRKLIEWLETNF